MSKYFLTIFYLQSLVLPKLVNKIKYYLHIPVTYEVEEK